MMELPILYSRNSNGKINQWQVRVESIVSSNVSNIVVEEGILGGKLTSSSRLVKSGKNIGKMNETDHYEQAKRQAQSRWEEKRKKGYKSLNDLGIQQKDEITFIFEGTPYDPEELGNLLETVLPLTRTDANNLTKPMKCQQYFKDDGTPRITFPCYGQPKLNGFRVMARWESVKKDAGTLLETTEEKVVFRSKEGLAYTILEHIEQDFKKEMFFPVINGKQVEVAFDGEMYIHGEILSEISSAVRKRNAKTEKLRFCIFDIAVEGIDQKTRATTLYLMNVYLTNNSLANGNLSTSIIPCCTVLDNEEAQGLTDNWIKQGYEGGVFRDMKAHYQFGSRPKTMVKLKRSEDKEFKILDVIGGENAPDLGMFVCVAENGKTFTVNPEGSHDTRRAYLTNKENYIGKKLTVRFFERTKDDLPFHAVGVAVRDYE